MTTVERSGFPPYASGRRSSIAITHCDAAHLQAALAAAHAGATLAFGCSGTISTTLTISIPLTLTATGQHLRLTGRDRTIVVMPGAALTLNALTVLADVNAVVVRAGGSLVLNNVVIEGHKRDATNGPGIINDGHLTMRASIVSGVRDGGGGGGGITNDGEAFISDSTIKDNLACPLGGGILNAGRMTIVGSTISANHGCTYGGGLSNGGQLTIVNSTVSGNQAVFGGGINILGGHTMIVNSTISGNNSTSLAGGLYYLTEARATVTLSNTILDGNHSPSDANCIGLLHSGGYNILSLSPHCTVVGPATIHDQHVQTLMLGALRDNGGPTLTMADDAGPGPHPAVDAIPAAACVDGAGQPLLQDQRGYTRSDDREKRCDIGAYESRGKQRTAQ